MKKVTGFLEFLLFAAIWTYCILKLFFVDIDVKLINSIQPGWEWALDYKFIFILPFVVVFWILAGTKKFVSEFFSLLFFPFFLFFWQIPKLFYKRGLWFLMFGYFTRIIAFFFNLRTSLILLSIFLTSWFLVSKYDQPYVVLTGMSGIVVLVIYHFYDRILMIFSPLRVFSLDVTNYIQKLGEGHYLDKFFGNKKANVAIEFSALMPDARQLLRPVLFFTLMTFFHSGLKKIRNSRIYIFYACIKVISSIILLTLLFGLINLALYKVMPGDFRTTGPTQWFDFIYYSFNALFFSSIGYIIPAGTYARIISMCIPFSGILLIGIFIGLLFTFRGDRSKVDLDTVIAYSSQQVLAAEKMLMEQYGVTIREAMQELEKAKSKLYEVLKNIRDIS